MTDGIILDGLLVAAVILYVPIGALRGGLRESILGGSILLGMALATTRPGSWAERLASVADLSSSRASFAVSIACLASVALVLGVGGGTLCDRRVPSWRGRILGAGLGGINATVLTAFVLITHEEYARGGARLAAVTDSYLARTLIDHVDLVILTAVGIAAFAVVIGHLSNRIIGVTYDTDLEPALTWLQSTQRPPRSVRIPAEADGGKVEPKARSARSVSPGEAIRATRPVYADRRHSDRAMPDLDGWTDLPWHDDEPPHKTDGVPANRGQDHGISLEELHRLLRIGPDADRLNPPAPWSFAESTAPECPRHDGERSIHPLREPTHGELPPGRCHQCDSVLPDPTLPCPFCDDRR